MKYLLAFLLGAGTGVIGTYLYFKNKINEQINEQVDEQVNKEMKYFYDHQTQTMSAEEVEEVTEEDIEKEKVSDKPETQEKTSIIKMEETVHTSYRNPDKDKETYHGNDGIEEDEDEITDEEMEELMAIAQSRMEEQPQIVTEEEQTTMLIGYDNVEYIWYPKENFITDDMDKRLEEQDLLDVLFKPIDWRKELKNKEKIIVRVTSDATYYTVWNHDLANW